ncbi:hypothetical protein K474DRAFT_1700561 [Panus rudis PR-1116 ss-1]|nr:hypothetical protein K474DRAFT_1700561 [Panus rudis PR-1116 ss-1]
MADISHSTSAHQAVQIPELLSLILSFLDEQTVARTATVSRRWADVALDISWKHVRDIRQLLCLLAPLTTERRSGPLTSSSLNIKWRRRIQRSDWDRLSRYASRIRKIRFTECGGMTIDISIWEEMSRTRPTGDILPNLHSLSWHTYSAEKQHFSTIFLHPGLTHLSICIHRSPDTSSYVREISSRGAGIRHLDIRIDTSVADVQDDIMTLLDSLPGIEQLTVPLYCLSSAIVEQLARLKQLTSVSYNKSMEKWKGDRTDVAHFAPFLFEGAFPSLRRLSISAQLNHALNFMTCIFAPKNLTRLYIHAIATDDPAIVRQLFEILSLKCKSLQELVVDYILEPNAPLFYPPPPLNARPSIDTFRPLLTLTTLKKFEFRWDYQLNLTRDDMFDFATSWPSLEILMLNCQPVPELTPPVLTPSALLPFAEHCPKLRHLGLYLNADAIPTSTVSEILHPFQALEILSVGASCIGADSTEAIALFLSQICPLNCQIVAGVRWPDAYGIALDRAGILDHRRVRLTEWWVRWKDVARVLPLAIKARLDERSRMAAVQAKMEALVMS